MKTSSPLRCASGEPGVSESAKLLSIRCELSVDEIYADPLAAAAAG
jgi:hypothetical protein